MLAVTCHICEKEYLVGYRSLAELHNTEHGPVGIVDPPCGHKAVLNFRTGESVPVSELLASA